jgi:hypothetical protein
MQMTIILSFKTTKPVPLNKERNNIKKKEQYLLGQNAK